MTFKRGLQIMQGVLSLVLLIFILWQMIYSNYESTKYIFHILVIINLVVMSATIISNRKHRTQSSPKTIIIITGLAVIFTIFAIGNVFINALKKVF